MFPDMLAAHDLGYGVGGSLWQTRRVPAHGEILADELDTEIKKLVATLDPMSDEQWRRTAAAEGWPVGLVVFHVAIGLERQAGWIERALEGGPPHEFSRDATN